ncbi:MAG: Hint domain-containing protein [Pseudomonadota bacterium]
MLNPGDILFVGWDADNEDIAFVTTVDLPAGEVIYFTDDEWDGSTFNGSEQYMEWTVPVGGVSAGTVVTIDMDNANDTATIDVGGGFDYMRGGGALAQNNEMFWAFQGTRVGQFATPTNFISVIGNEDNGNFNQSPELSGTGLTTDNGAVIIDGDEDYMEWVGDAALSNPVERQDLIASVLDLDNWVTADGGGNNNPNGTGFDLSVPPVVCFVAGAHIDTPDGPRPVERLGIGDLVSTRDHGPQRILWVGARRVRAVGRFAPVEFATGAVGNDAPFRVSPQHRMLVTGWRAQLHFGEDEVLVAAKAMIDEEQIRQVSGGWVHYIHILLARHEIVEVEGCPAESLFLGAQSLAGLSQSARNEIRTLFPHAPHGQTRTMRPVRPVIRGPGAALARQSRTLTSREAG